MSKELKEKLIHRRKKSLQNIDVDLLFNGIQSGDVSSLSKGITLIESVNPVHRKLGQELIKKCLPFSGNSFRIGITGVPGVGKSTFIEAFGNEFIKQTGGKVAVLAIDPSSEKSGGSILGDKTRMNELSTNPNVFIRPSASGKTLGGVAQKTRESILLCEAAGFTHIIIETVGVGQSETAVKHICDIFLLLMLAGAGDELQGIKRGIMEMADAILITKADGKNKRNSNIASQSYRNALALFPPNTNEWIPKVLVTSSQDKIGFDATLKLLDQFKNQMKVKGFFESNRKEQDLYWLDEAIGRRLNEEMQDNELVQDRIEDMKQALFEGKVSSYQASDIIFETYISTLKK